MDILKQLKSEAEQVEVVDIWSEATTIDFEANQLKSSKVEETMGTAVRVIRNNKLGFSASIGKVDTSKLAANALESANYGDQIALTFPPVAPAPNVMTYDTRVTELPIPRLAEIGREMIDLIRSTDPSVHVNVSLRRGTNKISIRNQSGADIAFMRSPFSYILDIFRTDGDDVLNIYDMHGVTAWEEDYLAKARWLAEKLRLSKNLTSIQAGKMPVLFSPSGALTLMLPILEGINGKNVFTGVSPMKGKIGEKLFDEKITLVDDGTLSGHFGSAPYDDEGIPHRRNMIIRNGELQGFLYDLKTAAQAGVDSTGNGSRSFTSPPVIEPTNILLQPGDTPLAEIIANMDHGILVEYVLGMGQGNILSGAFSNPISLAFKIEKGEIVGRIKNVSIAGNIYELLKDVAVISKETQWVNHSLCLPYILLPEMNVVAKE